MFAPFLNLSSCWIITWTAVHNNGKIRDYILDSPQVDVWKYFLIAGYRFSMLASRLCSVYCSTLQIGGGGRRLPQWLTSRGGHSGESEILHEIVHDTTRKSKKHELIVHVLQTQIHNPPLWYKVHHNHLAVSTANNTDIMRLVLLVIIWVCFYTVSFSL